MRYSRTLLCVENGERQIGEIVEIGAIRYRIAKEISRAEFEQLRALHKLKLNQVFEVDAGTRSRIERPVDPNQHTASRCQRFYRLSRVAADK